MNKSDIALAKKTLLALERKKESKVLYIIYMLYNVYNILHIWYI